MPDAGAMASSSVHPSELAPASDTADGTNNYSTFFTIDSGVRTLLKTSDSIEKARQTVNDSEDVAKHALVDLELQRSQLTGVKDMVADTNSMTGQVRHYLQIIADRSYRRRVILWFIIIGLIATDISVFYLLYIR